MFLEWYCIIQDDTKKFNGGTDRQIYTIHSYLNIINIVRIVFSMKVYYTCFIIINN